MRDLGFYGGEDDLLTVEDIQRFTSENPKLLDVFEFIQNNPEEFKQKTEDEDLIIAEKNYSEADLVNKLLYP